MTLNRGSVPLLPTAIASRALRGAAAMAVSQYGIMALNFGLFVALSRLLLPEHFGLVSLATFYAGLAGLCRGLGLDAALIHRQEEPEATAATHLFLQLASAALALMVGTLLAAALSWLGQSSIALVLVALCGIMLVEAAGSTARTLLEKKLRFPVTAAINVAAYVAGAGAAILAALGGWGAWSLVAGTGTTQLILAGLAWVALPQRVLPRPNRAIATWMLRRWAPPMLAGSLLTTVLLQFDNFLIGNLLGLALLGYYDRAYRLATLPTGAITHVLSRVALPTYSALQSDAVRLSRAFGLTAGLIARGSALLAVATFVAAPELVLILMGDTWLAAVLPFRLLLGYALLRPLYDDSGAVLAALGRPDILPRAMAVQAAIMLLLGPPSVLWWGLAGIAMCVNVAMLIGVTYVYGRLRSFLDLDIWPLLGPPAAAALVALAGGLAVGSALSLLDPWAVLAAKVAGVGLLFGGVLLLLEGARLLRDLRLLRRHLPVA